MLALAACGVNETNPCEGVSGACLAVHVTGDVSSLDTLRFDLRGAVTDSFSRPLAGGGLPAVIAVLLKPGAHGMLAIDGVTLLGSKPVAAGSGSVTLVDGAHNEVHIHLTSAAPSCTNGARDPGESDVDCGGSCGPCVVGKQCLKGTGFTSGKCAGTCQALSLAFSKKDLLVSAASPWGVAVADMNRDGRLDIVYSNSASTTLDVALNNGNGFDAPMPATTYNNAHGITIGDVNHDGTPDVIVALPGSGQVQVFFGNGNGTFHAGTAFTLGGQPNTVWLIDYTGDGQLDLAVSLGAGGLTLVPNIGNGNLNVASVKNFPINASLGTTPADFNLDGKVDLAAPANGAMWSSSSTGRRTSRATTPTS